MFVNTNRRREIKIILDVLEIFGYLSEIVWKWGFQNIQPLNSIYGSFRKWQNLLNFLQGAHGEEDLAEERDHGLLRSSRTNPDLENDGDDSDVDNDVDSTLN